MRMRIQASGCLNNMMVMGKDLIHSRIFFSSDRSSLHYHALFYTRSSSNFWNFHSAQRHSVTIVAPNYYYIIRIFITSPGRANVIFGIYEQPRTVSNVWHWEESSDFLEVDKSIWESIKSFEDEEQCNNSLSLPLLQYGIRVSPHFITSPSIQFQIIIWKIFSH